MRVACAQLDAKSMDAAAEVWPIVESMAGRAESASADLLVFPEVTYPSYWLESRERYCHADIERTASVLDRFSRLAAKHGLWIVAGLVEESGGDLFNSAAIFDRGGRQTGMARKQFMWDCDRTWFTPGAECTVLDTEFGRMGVLICADLRMPEISATLAAKGAQFVVQPTAWVNASRVPGAYRNIQPEFLLAARALEFGLPFISCSKSGRDTPSMGYVGQSRMVDDEGETLATAEIEGDALVVTEVSPSMCRTRPVDARLIEQLMSTEPPFTSEPASLNCDVRLRHGPEDVVRQLQGKGARIARFMAAELDSFAPARLAALNGDQVIVVADSEAPDMRLARARAAENRVFLLCFAGGAMCIVVDPTGAVLWQAGDKAESIQIDVGLSDRKSFTPTTDIWSQRRVACYRFAPR